MPAVRDIFAKVCIFAKMKKHLRDMHITEYVIGDCESVNCRISISVAKFHRKIPSAWSTSGCVYACVRR